MPGGGGASTQAYATVPSVASDAYWPHGAVKALNLGNGVTEASVYNNRLQMTRMTASTAAVTRLDLLLSLASPTVCGISGGNNGDLGSQTISYPASGTEAALNVLQTYSYDCVNRLTALVEGNEGRTNAYDGFGNRWVTSTSSGLPRSPLTPAAQNWFDPANNRIVADMGAGYDGSGNQSQVNPFSLTYDAENRLTQAVEGPPANVTVNYAYDADGRRVQKTGSAAATYVYDGFGNLAAEYGTGDPADGTQYLTADHLGSTRLVTNAAGGVVHRYDYLPFGEGIAAGVNGRSSLYSTSTFDGLTVKFTGKERDAETGLDYFGARYYSGAQGRFTSADPVMMAPERLRDPQQLNLYVYARNNPLKYIDPTGTIINDVACQANTTCASWEREYRKSKEGQAQWKKLDDNQKLTVTLKWDSKAKQSTTTDQNWDEQGNLVSATVTLAKATGDPSNHMDPESYPLGSAISSIPERQVYVVAHELAHVEDAQTPAGRASMQEVQRLFPDADASYKAEGYAGYAKDVQLQKTFEVIRTDNKRNENVADKRAAGIVESYRACTQTKGGCQ
jgi:RHS repeat-associated protein